MPGLRGYSPLGGSSRRYRTPSGQIISRREYDNRRAKAVGFRNRYELERLRQSRVGRKWGMDIIEQGHRPTFQDWGDINEIRDRRRALQSAYPDMERRRSDALDPELSAPDGPLARILDRTGRRPLSNRPVGAS